jgi:hypothetical protein
MRQQTIPRGTVDEATVSQLQSENGDLRDLVVHLSNVLLRNVMRQLALSRYGVQSLRPNIVSASEVAPRLRELALLCAHISRESAPGETAREMESLSIELADTAQQVAAVLDTSQGQRDGAGSD